MSDPFLPLRWVRVELAMCCPRGNSRMVAPNFCQRCGTKGGTVCYVARFLMALGKTGLAVGRMSTLEDGCGSASPHSENHRMLDWPGGGWVIYVVSTGARLLPVFETPEGAAAVASMLSGLARFDSEEAVDAITDDELSDLFRSVFSGAGGTGATEELIDSARAAVDRANRVAIEEGEISVLDFMPGLIERREEVA